MCSKSIYHYCNQICSIIKWISVVLSWAICTHECFYTFFVFAINSFNSNLSSNFIVFENKEKEKKKEIEKKKRKKKKYKLWHYEDYNIFAVLFTQLSFILLYNSLCVQLSFLVLYLCLILFIFAATINNRSWEKYKTVQF